MIISEHQADLISEILRLALGRASYALVELVHENVTIHVPSLAVLPVGDIKPWLRSRVCPDATPAAVLRFHGLISGTVSLLFPLESAIRLASALGVEPTSGGLQDVVEETGNLVLNAVAGCFANCLECDLAFDRPHYTDAAAVMADLGCNAGGRDQVLIAQAFFALAELTLEGQILFHLDTRTSQGLIAALSAMTLAE